MKIVSIVVLAWLATSAECRSSLRGLAKGGNKNQETTTTTTTTPPKSIVSIKGRDFGDTSETTDSDGNTIETASSGTSGNVKYDDGSETKGKSISSVTNTTNADGELISQESGSSTAGSTTESGGATTGGRTFTENTSTTEEDGTKTTVDETGASGKRKDENGLLGDSQTAGSTGSGSITVENPDGSVEQTAFTFTKGNSKNDFVATSGQSGTDSTLVINEGGTEGTLEVNLSANGNIKAKDGSGTSTGNVELSVSGTITEEGFVEEERNGKSTPNTEELITEEDILNAINEAEVAPFEEEASSGTTKGKGKGK